MSILTDENIILTNNEPIENIRNRESYKNIRSYYAGLKSVTKSSCNILRKIDDHKIEKTPQTDNYGSEIYDNNLRRKSQFDIFKNNVGFNYECTNTSDCSKTREKKDPIRKKSNESILNTKSSRKSNFFNGVEMNSKNIGLDTKSKFSEFKIRKSHKRNSKFIINDERRNLMLKIRNSAFGVRTSCGGEILESQNNQNSVNITQYSFIKTEDLSNSKMISCCDEEREINLSLNASIYRDKTSSKVKSNRNTPFFQRNQQEKYLSFLGDDSNNQNDSRVNFFTLKENKEDMKDNQIDFPHLTQLKFQKRILWINDLNTGFYNKKNESTIMKIKKDIKEFERSKVELRKIEIALKNNKHLLKEVSDNRNQLIANKINLENNFDSLAIRFNKLQEKNREYFTVKDKISNNLKLENSILNIYNSPNKGIVNTEKNLDELIYELENKFAFMKLENGIISEKIDNIDESIEVNEIKQKNLQRKLNSLNFQIEFFQNKIRNKNDDNKNKSNYLSHFDNKKDLSLCNKSQNDFSKLKNINLNDLSFYSNKTNRSRDKEFQQEGKCGSFTNKEYIDNNLKYEDVKEMHLK